MDFWHTQTIVLIICEKYFTEHGIKISTNVILEKSKTKCMVFNLSVLPASIVLYDTPLPWVQSFIHLGHRIHVDESMSHDLLQKRAEFISKLHGLRQEIGIQNPNVFMTLVFIYLSSMYGSNLWNLFSNEAEKLFSSWNILIKNTYDLPFPTHRYISQEMFHRPHIRICLLRRFVKFYNKLKLSNKPEVVHLFEIQQYDYRSSFGNNCKLLCNENNVARMEDINIENISMPIKLEERDSWRIPFLKELLSLRSGYGEVGISKTEMQDIINHLCCD